MSSAITPAHILLALAALAALFAAVQALSWSRNRAFGRGTPQYARARDGRRFATLAAAAAFALLLAGLVVQ